MLVPRLLFRFQVHTLLLANGGPRHGVVFGDKVRKVFFIKRKKKISKCYRFIEGA